MTETTADDIDVDFVARCTEPEAAVVLDGDEVLYLPGPSRLFTLNPTARVVWHSLDGEVSVGDLARELAEEFGVDVETMTRDVLGLVRDLGRNGLLDGVAGDAAIIESQTLLLKTTDGRDP